MAAIPSQISRAAAARQQYDLAYQVSPIFLVGGAFGPRGAPITQLYNQSALLATTSDPNAFLARYVPLPGSTLLAYAVGNYPFPNQQLAANSMIKQPLTLSMLMIAPINQPGGFAGTAKQSALTSLFTALDRHNTAGGYYNVATPAFLYTGLLLTGVSDVTHSDSQQQQIEFQLDFTAPLVTLESAAAALGSIMQSVTNGAQVPAVPTYSGTPQSQLPQNSGGLPSGGQNSGPLPSAGLGIS